MSKPIQINLKLKDAYAYKHALQERVALRNMRLEGPYHVDTEEATQIAKDLEHEERLLADITTTIQAFEARINRPREEITNKCGTCAWPTGSICLNFKGEEGKKAAVGHLSGACGNYLEDTLSPAYKAALEPVDEDDQDVITWEAYLEDVLRTLNTGLTPSEVNIMGSMGLAGEAAEVLEIFKKVGFHGHPYPAEKVIEEIGDVCYYLGVMLMNNRLTLEQVLAYNVQKRLERFPNGFKAEDSINRTK